MTESNTSRTTRVIGHALDELGLVTMWRTSRDVKFLCAQRFVRLFAYGGSTLILASYLSAIGISDDRIGLFMTLTLVGDVVISFFLTLFADAMGRKTVLSLGSMLMAGSGVIFALFGNYWVLLAAAVFGVISPRYVLLPLAVKTIAYASCVVGMKLDLFVLWRSLRWLILHLMKSFPMCLRGIRWSGLQVLRWDS